MNVCMERDPTSGKQEKRSEITFYQSKSRFVKMKYLQIGALRQRISSINLSKENL